MTVGAAAVTLAGSLLAGCSSAEAVPAEGAVTGDPATDLTITLREVGGRGEAARYTLSCDPVGGDLPNALPACANLAEAVDPFAAVPAGSMCAQVIAGPGVVAVEGTWEGAAVQAQFSQVNSCESARFQRLLETLSLS